MKPFWAQLTSPAQLCHWVFCFNGVNGNIFQNKLGGQASSILDSNDWIWFTSWLDVSPPEDKVSEARSTSRLKHLSTKFWYSKYLFSCHLAGSVSSLYRPKFSKGISSECILWHTQACLRLCNTWVALKKLWFQWSRHCSAYLTWLDLADVPSAFLFSAQTSFRYLPSTASVNALITRLWGNNVFE